MNANKNVRYGIVGFGYEPKRLPPEAAARLAVQKHTRLLPDTSALELLITSMRKKNRLILRFLYRNDTATMDKLQTATEPELFAKGDSGEIDTLRKAINRLNDELLDEGVPLRVVKERGSTGYERVWLDVSL